MSAIDVAKLLLPVTDESPCGDDLEYDPAFQELERTASVAKPPMVPGEDEEDQEEPEPPNWREVAEQAETLLGRTKDLRAAMYLMKARLDTHGVTGLRDGIALIKGLLTDYWDEVHPRLDEEDDNDPQERINSLLSLGDADEVLRQLGRAHLVRGKRAGSFSLYDMRVAGGEIPPRGGSEPPDSALINEAFMESDLEELQANADAVAQAIDDVQAIENYLSEKVGPANNNLTVKPLVDELIRISAIYTQHLEARGVDVETVAGSGDGTEGRGAPVRASGEITSREDAIRMLDKVSEYFRRNEPSSPVPMLLQRAKGLIAKDFMEILRDLTPAAIKEAEFYSGPADKD